MLAATPHRPLRRPWRTAGRKRYRSLAGRLSRVRTLYRNGRFHTPSTSAADALLVEDHKIVSIGVSESVGDVAADRVIDLQRALVTPAFVDAHVHTTATGLSLAGLDLGAAASLSAALGLIGRAAGP